MIIANPVISTGDKRFFRVNYPWLLEDELILSAHVVVKPPIADLVGLFTLSGSVSEDGKYLILYTNPILLPEGPPLEGTEYIVDIEVLTDKDQTNRDSLVFVIDDGVYP